MCRQVWLVAGFYDPAMLSASSGYKLAKWLRKVSETHLISFTITMMTLLLTSDEVHHNYGIYPSLL